MKTILLLSILLSLARGEDITALGYISSTRALLLETDRTYLLHFSCQALPLDNPTNILSFTTTNQLLTLTNFYPPLSNHILLSIHAVRSDNQSSPTNLYHLIILPSPPPKVTLRTIQILNPDFARSLTQVLHSYKSSQTNAPQPPIPTSSLQSSPIRDHVAVRTTFSSSQYRDFATAKPLLNSTNQTNSSSQTLKSTPQPLPGATNLSYADRARMNAFYQSRTNQHRSE